MRVTTVLYDWRISDGDASPFAVGDVAILRFGFDGPELQLADQEVQKSFSHIENANYSFCGDLIFKGKEGIIIDCGQIKVDVHIRGDHLALGFNTGDRLQGKGELEYYDMEETLITWDDELIAVPSHEYKCIAVSVNRVHEPGEVPPQYENDQFIEFEIQSEFHVLRKKYEEHDSLLDRFVIKPILSWWMTSGLGKK